MRYYQFSFRGESHFGVETSDDTLYDLTAANPQATDLFALLRAASLMGVSLDHVARQVIDRGMPNTFSLEELHENSAEGAAGPRLELPFRPPEVWAAGVTYENSMFERQAESGTPDVYGKVYKADRPEVFFKATPSRLSGPYGEVGIRAGAFNYPTAVALGPGDDRGGVGTRVRCEPSVGVDNRLQVPFPLRCPAR